MTYQECIESLIEIKELLVYLLAEKGEKSIDFAIQALEGIQQAKQIAKLDCDVSEDFDEGYDT